METWRAQMKFESAGSWRSGSGGLQIGVVLIRGQRLSAPPMLPNAPHLYSKLPDTLSGCRQIASSACFLKNSGLKPRRL